MKTLQKIFIFAVALIINSNLYSQESNIDFDRLITGKNYKVLLKNDWETDGKLIKKDTNYIEIMTEYKSFTIQKNEIKQIVNSENGYDHSRLYLSIGTGINFATSYFEDFSHGVNIQFNITKVISPSFGVRGDFQFGQIKRNVYERNNAGNYYSKSEGGDFNNYSLKFDFLLGNLRQRSKLNAYGILGGGFNVVVETNRNTTTSYRSYYNNNQYSEQTNSYTATGFTFGELILELGGGLGYKISDNVRIYGEAQYGTPVLFISNGIGFFHPGSILYGNPTLKIGAQISL